MISIAARRLPVVVREDLRRLAGIVAAARCWRRVRSAMLRSGELVDAALAYSGPGPLRGRGAYRLVQQHPARHPG